METQRKFKGQLEDAFWRHDNLAGLCVEFSTRLGVHAVQSASRAEAELVSMGVTLHRGHTHGQSAGWWAYDMALGKRAFGPQDCAKLVFEAWERKVGRAPRS